MIKIYHNPRCSKSRAGVQFLKEKNVEFEIVEYLKNQLDYHALKEIIEILEIQPIDLVRTNENIWKENYKNLSLSDDEIIQAMVENPRLIERPIVVRNNQAVIGRPTENINKIL